MPIISEGYASTKIQGGTRGKTKVEENPVQMKANVIEQAQVEEISSTKQVDSLYKNSKFDLYRVFQQVWDMLNVTFLSSQKFAS